MDLLCPLFRARVLTDVNIGCSGGSCEIRLISCPNQFISQATLCRGLWYSCVHRDLSASLWICLYGDRSPFDPRYHLVKLFILTPQKIEKDAPSLHCLEIHLDLLCPLFRARVLTDVNIGCSGGSCEIRLISCLNQFISRASLCTGMWYGCVHRDLSASS